MSIPDKHITEILDALLDTQVENLLTQVDARRILEEVHQSSGNFPNFDKNLSEKTTHIAYSLLACGCSIIENGSKHSYDGLLLLERAGKILSDAYKFNTVEQDRRNQHLLISGMALYASKQFSRAFIVLNDVTADFVVGQMVINFIKKDFDLLYAIATDTFFASAPPFDDIRELDEWVISHEVARCFLICLSFIKTGDHKNFSLISDILDKLIQLTTESNLTLFWLILRLLKIIFISFLEQSLWTVLPPLLPIEYFRGKYIQLLSDFKSPVVELWPSQTDSLHLATGDNLGAVINLRTSGGKTRVAEIAILQALSKNPMAKILYLAPFRSLAFEVEQTLSKTFTPLGFNVSQLYGGSTASVMDIELINESQIIIATPEKAKAMIRSGTGLENKINLIIMDEGHLFGATKREVKNEIFLTHISEFATRNKIRILLLSAVLPNSSQLAEWIVGDPTAVAKSEWKPAQERVGLLLWNGSSVKLQWKGGANSFNPNFVEQALLGFSRRRNPFPNNKNEAVAATAVRLAETGTVMIFAGQASWVKGHSKRVLTAMGEHPKDFEWDTSIWEFFENICKEELEENSYILASARKGVICHSNHLPTLVRLAIERLMRSKPPLIVIATTTLGQGVNIGISTVIIASLQIGKDTKINHRDFWNICGRAGRAFVDMEGKILYAIDKKISKSNSKQKIQNNIDLAKKYLDMQSMESVESGLMVLLRAFHSIAERVDIDFSILIEAVANDTLDVNMPADIIGRLQKNFDYIDDELLAMNETFCETHDCELQWVDDVFRKSLAILQADPLLVDDYIRLIRARVKGLIQRIPSHSTRIKLISTGVPLSVSLSMIADIDYFRSLIITLMEAKTNDEQMELLVCVVEKIEQWCLLNATNILESVPDLKEIELIRSPWLRGGSLKEIICIVSSADKIVKEFYGFTLPWIIHGISQVFDLDSEKEIKEAYSFVASSVELGLPNITAINIFLAGVRSRNVAFELSALEIFNGGTVVEIKKNLSNYIPQEGELSDNALQWLNFFIDSALQHRTRKITFPRFVLQGENLPSRLYLKHVDNKYFLTSSDGYVLIKVESTENFPFSDLPNDRNLYFEQSNGAWFLKSFNLHTHIAEN